MTTRTTQFKRCFRPLVMRSSKEKPKAGKHGGQTDYLGGRHAAHRGGFRAMLLCRIMLACVLCLLASPPAIRADESSEKLNRLRDDFQTARNTVASNREWDYEASKELTRSSRALITMLLDHWVALPADSKDAPAVGKEIQVAFGGLAGSSSTEGNVDAQSFLARIAWPLLADATLTKQQTTLLAELIKPRLSSRWLGDVLAQLDKPSEPFAWDLQVTYALALMRMGEDKRALKEVANLQRKVFANFKASPAGKLDYGPEAGEARYRDYVDYLQACELLNGLRAAIAGDHEGAAGRVQQARQLRDSLSPEAGQLVAEIERLAAAQTEE